MHFLGEVKIKTPLCTQDWVPEPKPATQWCVRLYQGTSRLQAISLFQGASHVMHLLKGTPNTASKAIMHSSLCCIHLRLESKEKKKGHISLPPQMTSQMRGQGRDSGASNMVKTFDTCVYICSVVSQNRSQNKRYKTLDCKCYFSGYCSLPLLLTILTVPSDWVYCWQEFKMTFAQAMLASSWYWFHCTGEEGSKFAWIMNTSSSQSSLTPESLLSIVLWPSSNFFYGFELYPEPPPHPSWHLGS